MKKKAFRRLLIIMLMNAACVISYAQLKAGDATVNEGASTIVSLASAYQTTLDGSTGITYRWYSESPEVSVISYTMTSCKIKGESPTSSCKVFYQCSYYIDGFYRTVDIYYNITVKSNEVENDRLKPFIDIDFSGSFTKTVDEHDPSIIKNYCINGETPTYNGVGTMVFSNVKNVQTDPSIDVYGLCWQLGYNNSLLDVLRVGGDYNSPAIVELGKSNISSDEEVLRIEFDLWFANLLNGFMTVECQNAEGQCLGGFSMDVYSGVVAFNDFNNQTGAANDHTESKENGGDGMNIRQYATGLGSINVGDADICTDDNKSHFTLVFDYKALTLQGTIENGTNGKCEGAEMPMLNLNDASITDNKVAKFVIYSNYQSANYKAKYRRCWFDNLKIYRYPSTADGPHFVSNVTPPIEEDKENSQGLEATATAGPSHLIVKGGYENTNFTIKEFGFEGYEPFEDEIDVYGLDPETNYTFTFYVVSDNNTRFSKSFTFKTSALTMSTMDPKVVRVENGYGDVMVSVQTNLDDNETNVGFEWRGKTWTDDMRSNTSQVPIYDGKMEGYLRQVYNGYFWQVRPYYLSNAGNYHYGEWTGWDPNNISYCDPIVHTSKKIKVMQNTATVEGYTLSGTNQISTQGMKYWKKTDDGDDTMQIFNAETVEAKSVGQNIFVDITDLEFGTTYNFATFVITTDGKTYYGETRLFTTELSPGDVNMDGIVDISDIVAVINHIAGTNAYKHADVNGDEKVDISDIVAIINEIANK